MVTWLTRGGNPTREQSIPGKRPGWRVRQRARDARPMSDMVKARLLETQFPGLTPQGTRTLTGYGYGECLQVSATPRLYSLALSQRRRRDVKETNGNLRPSMRIHC
jgi:hypothetical protein